MILPFSFLSLLQRYYRRLRRAILKRGIRYILCNVVRVLLVDPAAYYCYYLPFKPKRVFCFRGEAYQYFYHRYNSTWRNERAVELPICMKYLQKYSQGSMLEVGNVFSHYTQIHHNVIDKYEKASFVRNIDVVDLPFSERYNTIISISTLEHVGWDESPRDPEKFLAAFHRLRQCLSESGVMVVTLPVGYNSYVDQLLQDDKVSFSERYCLKRVSRDNRWQECSWSDIQFAQYHSPFPAANGVLVGIVKKDL